MEISLIGNMSMYEPFALIIYFKSLVRIYDRLHVFSKCATFACVTFLSLRFFRPKLFLITDTFLFFNIYGSDIYLHHDNTLMPKKSAAWSSWNFLGTINSKTYITYWLNAIQVCKSVPEFK